MVNGKASMSRYRAAAIHFGICTIIAAILLALFWFVWYPVPLFLAVGGHEIFLVLLAVDVILGPVLTLVVFKVEKKSLKVDLAVIAFLQAAALVYGTSTLLAGRPVFVAGIGHRFDVVQASDVASADIQAAGKSLPIWGPQWVGIKQAVDSKERERILHSALAGVDYGQMPQYHAPLETMRDQLLKNARPMAELRAKNRDQDVAISAWLSKRAHNDQTAVFQGLKARSQDMAVILDAKTAAVIGIAPFKPWD